MPTDWADVLLLDAPCSGSGVLRRHPENRLQLERDAVARRAAEQAALLERAARLVRPGAHLLYATCSLLEQENTAVLEGFLHHHPEFHTAGRLAGDGTLWPHHGGSDGFFGVLLARRGP